MMKIRTFLAITCCFVFCMAFSINSYAGDKEVRNVPADFPTIQAAVDAGPSPDVYEIEIRVAAGSYAGAVIDIPVTIKGTDETVITSGVPIDGNATPRTAFRLYEGADGTEISHLMIQNNWDEYFYFGVFSRYVDSVSIHHLTIMDTVQGITSNSGDGWNISHNEIFVENEMESTGCGIFIVAWSGLDAVDNHISYNKTVCDYIGPFWSVGIKFSCGWGEVSGNIVYKNQCTHTGVEDGGFEINDLALYWDGIPTVVDNVIAFNDFRGSPYELYFWPEASEYYNEFSRNLGANRGEGRDGLTPGEMYE